MNKLQRIVLAVVLMIATEHVQASKSAPKPVSKNNGSQTNRPAPGEGYKSPVTGLTQAQARTIKFQAKKAEAQAKAEALASENNQTNLAIETASNKESISFTPHDYSAIRRPENFIQSTTPRTIGKTIQQQRAAATGLEIATPETSNTPMTESVAPVQTLAELGQQYSKPTNSSMLNNSNRVDPFAELKNMDVPTTTQARAEKINQRMEKQEQLRLKHRQQDAIQNLKELGFAKKVGQIAAENAWAAQQKAQGGELSLTAHNLKNNNARPSKSSQPSETASVTSETLTDNSGSTDRSASTVESPTVSRPIPPINQNGLKLAREMYQKQLAQESQAPVTQSYETMSPRIGENRQQIMEADIINASVNNSGKNPDGLSMYGRAQNFGRKFNAARKEKAENKAGERATKAEAQRQKIQDIQKQVDRLQTIVKEDATIGESQKAKTAKSDTINLLKETSYADLISVFISAPIASKPESPVTRTLAWSAITSKIADATGLTRLSRAYNNSSVGKVINKRIESINNWGSRQIDKIMNKRSATKEAEVNQVVHEMGQEYQNVVTKFNPMQKDIDVTVTDNTDTFSETSSVNSELNDLGDYNAPSSGRTSTENSRVGSPSSQRPLSRNSSQENWGQFFDTSSNASLVDVAL